MIIKRLEITAFGKFTNKTIELKPGLNLIFGNNEAGKTTLHAFIEGMLYGYFNPQLKKRSLLSTHQRYLPNTTSNYQGSMVFEHQGLDYRIERSLSKSSPWVKVYEEATGKDITETLTLDPVTKLADIAQFIDMPYTLYQNTLNIQQLNLKTNDTVGDELLRRLHNLKATKTEQFSLEKAIEHLNKHKDLIGTERAQTKPYALNLKAIENCTDELENAIKTHHETIELKEEIQTLETSLKTLNEAIEKKTQTIKIQENSQRKDRLEFLQEKVKFITISIEQAGGLVPKSLIETIQHHAISDAGSFKEIRLWMQQLSQALTRIETLESNLPHNIEPFDSNHFDKLSKHFHNAKNIHSHIQITTLKAYKDALESLENQIDSHQKSIRTKQEKIAILEKKTTFKTWSIIFIVPLLIRLFRFKLRNDQKRLSVDIIELKAKLDYLTEQHQVSKTQYDRQHKQHKTAQTTLQKIYDTYQVSDYDALEYYFDQQRERARACDQTRKIQDQITAYQQTRDQIEQHTHTLRAPYHLPFSLKSLEVLEQIERFTSTLSQTLENISYASFLSSIDASLPMQDYQTLPTNLQSLKHLEQEHHEVLRQYDSKTQTLEMRMASTRPIETIRYALAQHEKIKQQHDETLVKINQAIEILTRAATQIEINFAPELSESIASYLKVFTQSQYDDVKIRKDLAFTIPSPIDQQLKTDDYFSTGTLDQIYLSIRLGILKTLNKTNYPLLLDDVFVHFDQHRLDATLTALYPHLFSGQIILFTCHHREETILNKHQISFHKQTL